MKRRIADALYAVVFPHNRVYRHSWPLWNALPHRMVRWISSNYSPEP
jgi:hypothetical protein